MEKTRKHNGNGGEPNRRQNRIYFFLVIVSLAGIGLIARLFQIQVTLHETYNEMAAKQQENRVAIELPRGKIFDRRGAALSLNVPRSYSYAIHPYQFKNTQSAAKKISRQTGLSYNYVLEKLKSKSSFVFLVRQLEAEKAKKFQKVPELIELTEVKRYYPFGSITPRAVGLTNRDCVGTAGFELIFDSTLASQTGWEIVLEDAKGNEFKGMAAPLVEPAPGWNVVSTFDNVVQNIIVTELKNTIRQWQAKGGFAIVMLPRTGEVLGMHCEPEFNPNNPAAYRTETQKERTVVDMYEPGSTFKIVPMLAAMRSGVPLNDVIFCENGHFSVSGHRINDVHSYGNLTVEEVLIHSSNIGIAKISKRVGKEKLYEAARDLGFGLPTGIEVPGEARGRVLNPVKWDNILLATFGIGQGVSCTGIQLCAAYATIAADGVLLKPRLVRACTNPYNETVHYNPQAVRRGMSQAEAEKLTELLVRAVEEGTGMEAKIEGTTIAGKTGTAQKYIFEEKKYSTDRYIGSFIGFTVEEPRILCLVVIDEPKLDIYGGKVAAPCFRNIMQKVIPVVTAEQRSKFGPKESRESEMVDKVVMPEVINMDAQKAKMFFREKEIAALLTGEGKKITGQFPLGGVYISRGDTVRLTAEKPGGEIPDLRGKLVREAVKELVYSGYKVKVVGKGVVAEIQIEGKNCTLICDLSRIKDARAETLAQR